MLAWRIVRFVEMVQAQEQTHGVDIVSSRRGASPRLVGRQHGLICMWAHFFSNLSIFDFSRRAENPSVLLIWIWIGEDRVLHIPHSNITV